MGEICNAHGDARGREPVRVVVVGSINLDVVNRVEALPRAGETVASFGARYLAGGKGANAAVAAAAAGGSVTMVGALGTDPFAETLRAALASAGVDTRLIVRKPTTTGQAYIAVDANGQNFIVLSAGANGALTPQDVQAAADVLCGADVVLVQNEVPEQTTLAAIRMAHTAGVSVVYNPAPVWELPAPVYLQIETLVLNEHEAATLTRQPVLSSADAERAATELCERGARQVIVTLGEQGAVYADRDGLRLRVPAFVVDAVDTTAAGDIFVGTFVVAARQMLVPEALRFASAAAALAVTRPGAQASIPTRMEVEALLRNQPATWGKAML